VRPGCEARDLELALFVDGESSDQIAGLGIEGDDVRAEDRRAIERHAPPRGAGGRAVALRRIEIRHPGNVVGLKLTVGRVRRAE